MAALGRHAGDAGESLRRVAPREDRSAPAAPLERLPSPFGLREAFGHRIEHGGPHGHDDVATDNLDALGVRAAELNAVLPATTPSLRL